LKGSFSHIERIVIFDDSIELHERRHLHIDEFAALDFPGSLSELLLLKHATFLLIRAEGMAPTAPQ
jgi:hypothetical protein